MPARSRVEVVSCCHVVTPFSHHKERRFVLPPPMRSEALGTTRSTSASASSRTKRRLRVPSGMRLQARERLLGLSRDVAHVSLKGTLPPFGKSYVRNGTSTRFIFAEMGTRVHSYSPRQQGRSVETRQHRGLKFYICKITHSVRLSHVVEEPARWQPVARRATVTPANTVTGCVERVYSCIRDTRVNSQALVVMVARRAARS